MLKIDNVKWGKLRNTTCNSLRLILSSFLPFLKQKDPPQNISSPHPKSTTSLPTNHLSLPEYPFSLLRSCITTSMPKEPCPPMCHPPITPQKAMLILWWLITRQHVATCNAGTWLKKMVTCRKWNEKNNEPQIGVYK